MGVSGFLVEFFGRIWWLPCLLLVEHSVENWICLRDRMSHSKSTCRSLGQKGKSRGNENSGKTVSSLLWEWNLKGSIIICKIWKFTIWWDEPPLPAAKELFSAGRLGKRGIMWLLPALFSVAAGNALHGIVPTLTLSICPYSEIPPLPQRLTTDTCVSNFGALSLVVGFFLIWKTLQREHTSVWHIEKVHTWSKSACIIPFILAPNLFLIGADVFQLHLMSSNSPRKG